MLVPLWHSFGELLKCHHKTGCTLANMEEPRALWNGIWSIWSMQSRYSFQKHASAWWPKKIKAGHFPKLRAGLWRSTATILVRTYKSKHNFALLLRKKNILPTFNCIGERSVGAFSARGSSVQNTKNSSDSKLQSSCQSISPPEQR